LRDDVVLRVIRQLVEALLRAAGLRRRRELPAAQDAIGEGLAGLGLSLDVITRLDAFTLAGVLGDPTKCAVVAAALLELARVRDAEGDVRASSRLRATCTQLLEGVSVPRELHEALAPTDEDARMGW
jgi:hypothetical protein